MARDESLFGRGGPLLKELSPFVKRFVPWLFVGVGFLLSFYLVTLTPPDILLTPGYLASLLAWGVVGRMFLPLRQSIRDRRIGKPPVVGWWIFALLLLTTGLLTSVNRDQFLPLAAGFAGFFAAISIFLIYYLTWGSKLLFCVKCGTYKAFLQDHANWYCSSCGTRWDGEVSASRLGP